jgi:hypothetical protein
VKNKCCWNKSRCFPPLGMRTRPSPTVLSLSLPASPLFLYNIPTSLYQKTKFLPSQSIRLSKTLHTSRTNFHLHIDDPLPPQAYFAGSKTLYRPDRLLNLYSNNRSNQAQANN